MKSRRGEEREGEKLESPRRVIKDSWTLLRDKRTGCDLDTNSYQMDGAISHFVPAAANSSSCLSSDTYTARNHFITADGSPR
ncbi:hypothetical protein ACLKA6_001261 [Drosophila palustris]